MNLLIARRAAGRSLLLGTFLLGCRTRPAVPDASASFAVLDSVRWVGGSVPMHGPGRAKATLIRFWTDGCPHCRVSLPAIDALRREFQGRGLETLAIYHTRMPHPLGPAEIERAARQIGYDGPLASDTEWKALDALGLGERTGRTTSITLLLDHEGRACFVHPGPEIHPSPDPQHADCDRSFAELRARVSRVLAD